MAGTFVVFKKELLDHFGSKRYAILFGLILLLSIVSAYQGTDFIRNNSNAGFLAVFSGSRFGFSFVYSMVLFGPIVGLALGFDAINKERTSGTLSVLISQPIFRDSVINGKFLAGATALAALTLGTIGITVGIAIPMLGFGPTLGEASSILLLSALTILYLSFWLSLGVLFSVLTKKVSISTLSSVAIWLICSIMISVIATQVANALVPMPSNFRGMGRGESGVRPQDLLETTDFQALMQERSSIESSISKLSPTNLYSEVASSILGVTQGGRGFSMGFRNPTLGQSVTASWPNVAALAVGLVVCFAISYIGFVRTEVRPGG